MSPPVSPPDVAAEELRWAPYAWTAFWAAGVALALSTRPLLPIDETRYLAVAWEMWLRGDFLVPRLNGELYSHKPPLLFWLIDAGWAIAGVNEWWPRLVSPLAGLANLFLCRSLARALWPERPRLARLAPLLLGGCLLWVGFTSFVMFDMLLTTAVLVALLGLARAWRGDGARAWLLVGAGLGVGVLAKGPVALLPVLPAALLAPWWATAPRPASWRRWYLGLGGALVLAHAIALAWAIPAALAGGPEYGRAILFGQTAGRLVASFAHRRPWWWYLPWLPVALFPFALWRPVWSGLGCLRSRGSDAGLRFCAAWVVPAFVALSAVSGKQEHYLLPLFPALALVAAFAVGECERRKLTYPVLPSLGLIVLGAALLGAHAYARNRPLPAWAEELSETMGIGLLVAAALLLALPRRRLGRQVAALNLFTLTIFATVHLALAAGGARPYDLRPLALRLQELERRGVPVAHSGAYHGQFQFLGRLRRPLQVIHPGSERVWLEEHPGGRVIAALRSAPPNGLGEPEFRQPFRSGAIGLWGLPAEGPAPP
jgi:4-amino-4-deoxy-L-arabinose transferase-like glycosyltransferase